MEKSATQTYSLVHKEILAQIRDLQLGLKRHAAEFKQSPGNWGYVGDIVSVKGTLSELPNFAKPKRVRKSISL